MNPNLREPLRELARDVAGDLDTSALAGAAWRAGRRRRRRRRLLVTAGAAVVLAVLAGVGLSFRQPPGALGPAGSSSSPHVDGYPRRILHPWWTPTLPDRPGPVAGLVGLEAGPWDIVSDTGHLWRLDEPRGPGDEYPTLSPNGRFLGYLAGGRFGHFVIHDLVTGRQTPYPSVGSAWAPARRLPSRYWMNGQSPGFWSPDSTRLLLYGGLRADRRGPATRTLLLGRDGRARPLPMPTDWNPAGWVSPTRLVWTVSPRRLQGGPLATGVRVTDLSGQPIRDLTVRLPAAVTSDSQSQWSWTVSPTGRELLFITERTGGVGYALRYSLADGTRLGLVRVPGLWTPCSSNWSGTTPVVPVLGPHDAPQTVAALRDPRPVSVSDPALHANCLLWATDALSGSPHGGLFGTTTAQWTWWWREAITAFAALALTVAAVRALRTRLKRTQATQ